MNEAALVERLRRALPHLLAVYIFGSHATGDAGADSDLDLAVLVEGRVNPLDVWKLSGDLAEIVDCPVDLLDLRAASTVMQYQIVVHGRRLWNRDAGASIYEAFIMSEKLELDVSRAAVLADIQREGRVYGR